MRSSVLDPLHSIAESTMYHFEPFRLACKITGKKLSVRDFAQEYREILEEVPSG
jgi:hypothetical protein